MARSSNSAAIRPRAKARAFTASAKKINLRKKTEERLLKLQQEWQQEAWEFFDEVPEIKFITHYLGNAMAKLTIFPAVMNPDDPLAEPVFVGDPDSKVPTAIAQQAVDILARLRSPIGGQSEILRMLNMNLEVPGECWVVGFGPRVEEGLDGEMITIDEEYDVKSIREVVSKNGKWVVLASPKARPQDKDNRVLDPAMGDDIFRVWLRHPAWSMIADSLMRGVLGECRSLTSLSQQILAEANSRLHAGIILLPNELSFGPADPTIGEDGEEASEDEFDEALFDNLASAIEDPASAASVMPLVGRAPGELLQYARHLTFARTPDTTLDARIEARVRRIARGLNVPVEVAEGHAQTTFSNAEQIDQDIFDDHLQPRCVLIVDAITQGYLRDKMAKAGIDATWVDQIFCWFDPSALIRQPDATAASNFGLTEAAISTAAWRAKNGYNDADAPEREEILERVVIAHARAQLGPEVALALLKMLGIDIQVEAIPGNSTTPVNASQVIELIDSYGQSRRPKALAAATRPTETPGRQLVNIDIDLRTRLLVAADSALTRALEKAGNRLRSKLSTSARQLVRGVPAYRVASTLGRKLVAAAAPADELLSESWSALEAQFMQWGAQAQAQALAVADGLVHFDAPHLDELRQRQGEDLLSAWVWLRASMTTLAHDAMFNPDPLQEPQGETFGGRIPAGMIRSAVARAGGAKALTADAWVSLGGGGDEPAGGIGNGELVGEAMAEGGVTNEGWVWVYGPAFRAHTFEPHEFLDGTEFSNFDDEVLANTEGWPELDFYIPGDHDGCLCDVEPVLLGPDESGGGGPDAALTPDEGAIPDWAPELPEPQDRSDSVTHQLMDRLERAEPYQFYKDERERYAELVWEQKARMTSEQESAFSRYTGSGYKAINPQLRGYEPMSPTVAHWVNHIDEAFTAHATEAAGDEVLYRVAAMTQVMREQFAIGSVFADPGYLSTASSTVATGKFLHFGVSVRADQEVWLMAIKPKAGMKFLYGEAAETEFVFGRGTQFVVKAIDEAEHIMYLEG